MTGDPRRDHEATEHHLESLPADEYAAARAERERRQKERMDAAHEAAKAERDTCLRVIPRHHSHGTWTDTYCRRPSGHDGDCHPVPLAEDKEGGDG